MRAEIAQTREAGSGPAIDPETKGISRRAFLNYVWGASAALLLAETGGAAIWFALPHLKVGADLFQIDPRAIPLPGETPSYSWEADFWLTQTSDGLLALTPICPHDPTRYKW